MKLSNLSSKYGAPMGRANTIGEDHALTIQRLVFVDGDYDEGGAYWGAGKPIWRAFSTDTEVFVRATNEADVQAAVREDVPDATFDSCEGIEDFFAGYVCCAFWSSTDDGFPMDINYDESDLSDSAREHMEADCVRFLLLAGPMLGGKWRSAGNDFWLTRNGHGSGFWDGDWDKGDELTALSKQFGTCDLYVGDDGRVYCE